MTNAPCTNHTHLPGMRHILRTSRFRASQKTAALKQMSPSPRHPTHLDLRSALWPCLFSLKLPPGAVLWHRNAHGFQQAKRWCMVVVVAIAIAVASTVVEEPGPALLEGMTPSVGNSCRAPLRLGADVDVVSTCNSSVKRIRLRYGTWISYIRLYKII